MKGYDVYEAVNGIDPELIEAAMTPAVKKKNYAKYISIAAAAVILVVSIVIYNVTGNSGIGKAPVAETTTVSADNGDHIVKPTATTEPSGEITPENTTGKTTETTTLKPAQDSTKPVSTTKKPAGEPSVNEKTTHKEEVTAVTTTRPQVTDPVSTTKNHETTTEHGAGGNYTPPETTTTGNEHAKPPTAGGDITVMPDFGTPGFISWLDPVLGNNIDSVEDLQEYDFTSNFIVINGKAHERISNSQLSKYGLDKAMDSSDIRNGKYLGTVLYNKLPGSVKNGICSSNKIITNGNVYEYNTTEGKTVYIVIINSDFVCYK